MLEYLGDKYLEVCNLLSNGSTATQVCIYIEREKEKVEEEERANIAKC